MSAAGIDFLPQQHVATPRGDYVHAEYVARAHRGEELNAIVTAQGRPIEARGEVLRIGMVPPERRYAIGPVKDGRAEVLPQLEFEQANTQHYIDAYAQVPNAKLDKPDLRYIPNVREFVAVKVHPADPKRLLPLGQPVEGGPPPAPPETFWSETLGREVTQAEVVKLSETKDDPRDAKIAALEQALEETRALIASAAAAQAPPAREQKMLTAPCGKQMKAGLPMHIRNCKQAECIDARPKKE